MAEAVFYVLATQSAQERLLFACRLIEKIYRTGQFCQVLTDTPQQSRYLDDLLWTFRAGSFIPHQVSTGGQAPQVLPQVLISTFDQAQAGSKTVLNLSSQCPTAERIIEILDDNEATKAAGRARYRQYQVMGMEMKTHNISAM